MRALLHVPRILDVFTQESMRIFGPQTKIHPCLILKYQGPLGFGEGESWVTLKSD